MSNPNDRTRKQPHDSPARCRQLRRVVRHLERSLKLAIAIIRNDAGCCEHHQPNKAETRWRWANELEIESGLRKRKTPNDESSYRSGPVAASNNTAAQSAHSD